MYEKYIRRFTYKNFSGTECCTIVTNSMLSPRKSNSAGINTHTILKQKYRNI